MQDENHDSTDVDPAAASTSPAVQAAIDAAARAQLGRSAGVQAAIDAAARRTAAASTSPALQAAIDAAARAQLGRSAGVQAAIDAAARRTAVASTSPALQAAIDAAARAQLGRSAGVQAAIDAAARRTAAASTSPALQAAIDAAARRTAAASTSPALQAAIDAAARRTAAASTSPALQAAIDAAARAQLGRSAGVQAAIDAAARRTAAASTSPALQAAIDAAARAQLSGSLGVVQRLGELAATVDLYAGSRWTRVYPDNLARTGDGFFLAEIREVVLGDGIALYGVPRPQIAEQLIRASSRADRRALLGRRWRAISVDCRDALARCNPSRTPEEHPFAMAAVEALIAGHAEAAQALSANLLDTILRRHFAAELAFIRPSRRVTSPDGLGRLVVRKFLALAPVWEAYQQFRPGETASIPRVFARHASAHAVNRRQFSRRNAVQAVLLVTSLVLYLSE